MPKYFIKFSIAALVLTAGAFVFFGSIKHRGPALARKQANTPTFEELKQRMALAARQKVNAYLEHAHQADTDTQTKIAEFYCDKFSALPVKDSMFVKSEYATAENCKSKGMPILRRLAGGGDVKAEFDLASLLNSTLAESSTIESNDAEAFKWYMRIANEAPATLKTSGFQPSPYKAIAANWIARFYKDGLSVPKDLLAAFKWYEASANIDNDPQTIKTIAEMLSKGEGTTKDARKAELLLEGIHDDDDAKFKLAEIYLFYDTQTPDRFDKAKRIFATLHDHARMKFIRHESSYYLGLLDYQGRGGERDYKSAFNYLLEASKFGEFTGATIDRNVISSGPGNATKL